MTYAIRKAQALVKKYQTRSPRELADLLGYIVLEHPFSPRIKGLMIKLFGTVVIGINSRLPDPLKKVL